MKVLSILAGTSARTGGPPAFVGGSALELAKLGASMRILSTDLALAPTGWVQSQRRVDAGEVHPTLEASDLHIYPARFPRRLAVSPQLYRAASRMAADSDVVHIHNLWLHAQYSGYRAARKRAVPYIVSPHGSLDPYLRAHGRGRKFLTTTLWQARMLEQASLIHVTTKAEQQLIVDIAPDVPRVVVPAGLYVEEFERLPPPEVFRRDRLGGYDGPIVLFFGRITYKKGVDALICAFAHARRDIESRLVIVGPDDEGRVPSLKELAARLGVGSDVAFVEPVYGAERLAALASADVWALSSHAENFGIAVVEAMAAGCAVVISPGVNLAADVVVAEAGVVAGLDSEEFGAALSRVLGDRDYRSRLQAAGRAFAKRYDWGTVGPQLLDMYERAARRGA